MTINSEFINPFVESTVKVISTMAKVDPQVGKPILKPDNKSWGMVSGMIGMVGENVTGSLVISFDEASILDIVSKMLMDQFSEINQEVIDAVGEITNMICGGTKSALSAQGFALSMASPVMFVGQNIEVSRLCKAPIICLPFSTPNGHFVVEINLMRKKT